MKNKQAILILFLLFNNQIVKSQITFQKSYDAQFHERIITSCATADGNYLLGGELDDVNKIFICKINPYGDIIWSKKYYHNTTETLTHIAAQRACNVKFKLNIAVFDHFYICK